MFNSGENKETTSLNTNMTKDNETYTFLEAIDNIGREISDTTQDNGKDINLTSISEIQEKNQLSPFSKANLEKQVADDQANKHSNYTLLEIPVKTELDNNGSQKHQDTKIPYDENLLELEPQEETPKVTENESPEYSLMEALQKIPIDITEIRHNENNSSNYKYLEQESTIPTLYNSSASIQENDDDPKKYSLVEALATLEADYPKIQEQSDTAESDHCKSIEDIEFLPSIQQIEHSQTVSGFASNSFQQIGADEYTMPQTQEFLDAYKFSSSKHSKVLEKQNAITTEDGGIVEMNTSNFNSDTDEMLNNSTHVSGLITGNSPSNDMALPAFETQIKSLAPLSTEPCSLSDCKVGASEQQCTDQYTVKSVNEKGKNGISGSDFQVDHLVPKNALETLSDKFDTSDVKSDMNSSQMKLFNIINTSELKNLESANEDHTSVENHSDVYNKAITRKEFEKNEDVIKATKPDPKLINVEISDNLNVRKNEVAEYSSMDSKTENSPSLRSKTVVTPIIENKLVTANIDSKNLIDTNFGANERYGIPFLLLLLL